MHSKMSVSVLIGIEGPSVDLSPTAGSAMVGTSAVFALRSGIVWSASMQTILGHFPGCLQLLLGTMRG